MAEKSEVPEGRDIVRLAATDGPFIMFEAAPNFGFNDGIANITLEAVRHTLVDGKLVRERVVVAYLRCGAAALQHLKGAIEGVELLAKPAEGVKN